MKNSHSTNPQNGPGSTSPQDTGFSPWQRLKSKRISYLTLPLLIMATITEFVILATGWKYQKIVCLPPGMAVTFFGIGPIGATILAVELLKLPLAIWTASRHGWQKCLMVVIGLPMICLLTFQLVKDMAVYEMGVALTPANQMLEKATDEEVKISQLKGELADIEAKKADRERKLAELAAKETNAEADLEQSLKRNDEERQDAISLTDYQRNQLNEVDAREAAIIQQFSQDTAQLTKTIADLQARRETEMARDTKWNAEQARIDNAYQTAMADYANKKAAYDKARAAYDNANFVQREFMKEPVDPGVPPVREVNTVLKSSLVADLDSQIKAKEAELLAVNNQRRDRVAQVEDDARKLRDEFDHRSGTRRDETDHKRDQLLAAQAALATQWKAERQQIDQELGAAVEKVDGIRAELDGAEKQAEGFYEAREAAIRTTQVHRIATTVEIVRALIKGERPMSIKATAKERGDILTDQISMVRIWVYPVLAFIVAFLPTLMVEIGFSTVFHPEQQRPPHRLGFLGRQLHRLYIRAGRQKILRAERLAREASVGLTSRDKALAEARAIAANALAEKETALQAAHEATSAATAYHEAQLARIEAEHEAQLTSIEEECGAQLAGMTESLNRAVAEKEALRNSQKSEIERQIQARERTWSDSLVQLRQEMDNQRVASEAERTALMQENHMKMLELSEDCKTQIIQTRRQTADAELAASEAAAKLNYELKETLLARDTAQAQLQQQTDSFAVKLSQAKEEAARELEKAARQEKARFERQQSELAKTLRLREEDFERQWKLREQELSLALDARLAEEQSKVEEESRRHKADLERQFEARSMELETRWKQEMQQQEAAAQARLKQREQQLQTQAEARLGAMQTQTEQELRRRATELERQLGAQSREANLRMKQELQQKELAFEAKLKQREQDLAIKAEARETELQNQWNSELRVREEEWESKTESRVRAAETRWGHEAQQKEELFQAKLRQRDQQWQVKLDAARAELQAQTDEALRRRELEADASRREFEAKVRKEMQEREESLQAKARQREQDFALQMTAQAEARRLAALAQWEAESDMKVRAAVEPFKAALARAEKERDEALQTAAEKAQELEELDKKLTDTSVFLNAWRNGKNMVAERTDSLG
jgi:hypothetical protein